MDINDVASSLNGSPDNAAARGTLDALERAGVFHRYTHDTSGRLGTLELDGRKFMVQREPGIWRTIKIWQIKVVPVS